MELTAEIKRLLQDAIAKLKGTDRRTFMAKTVVVNDMVELKKRAFCV